MDFRELLNKIDSIAEAGAYSKDPVRFTAQDVLPHVDEIKFTDPTPSMLQYSVANNPDFADKDINDPKVKLALFNTELKNSPARLFGDIAARIKPFNDEQIEISNIVNQVSDELASGKPIAKDHQQVLMAVIKKALKDMELIRDPDQSKYDDDSDEDEFEGFTPMESTVSEDDHLNEEGIEILWDEPIVKRGKGRYQAFKFYDGRKAYAPVAVDGTPIYTGRIRDAEFADELVSLGFGLPAYGDDNERGFQDTPDDWNDNSGKYHGTYKKVGSRWVALDQHDNWKDARDGDFYTDRSDDMQNLSYKEWNQMSDVRNIKHDIKMLGFQIQQTQLTDKKEAYEALLTVNRAYRGDRSAFEKMKKMIDTGTDIQVYIVGAGLRGSREVKRLVQNDKLKRAAMDRSFLANAAAQSKADSIEFIEKWKEKFGTDYRDEVNPDRNKPTRGIAGESVEEGLADEIGNMADGKNLASEVSKLPKGGVRRIQSNGNTVNFNVDKSKPQSKWSYQGKEYTIYATDDELEKFQKGNFNKGWQRLDSKQRPGTKEFVVSKEPAPKEIPTGAKTYPYNANKDAKPNSATFKSARQNDKEFDKFLQQVGEGQEWFNGLTDVTLHGDDFYEHFNWLEESLEEAEYQGRKVKLGKPMRGDVKKFKVYVKNPKGNVVKVNFGDPDMKIKAYDPERRKSFRARHNCDNPGPRHKARYWSCRKW